MIIVNQNYSNSTITRRAVFYIGPYGIKFALADVNIYESKIEELHYYAKSNIPYKNSIIYSENKRFTNAIMSQGITSILAHKKNLQMEFLQDTSIECLGIANKIFLQASNGLDFLDHICEVTGIRMKVLSEDKEPGVKYDSVMASIGPEESEKLVVWNAGKESMYLVDKRGEIYTKYEFAPDYDSFYDALKSELKREMLLNPMGKKDVAKALNLALEYIDIPEGLEFSNIIGTGPIHNYVAQHYVNITRAQKLYQGIKREDLQKYNTEDLTQAIDFLVSRDNKNILNFMYDKRSYYYVDKEISNMILIKASMAKMGVSEIRTVNPKDTFGLLLKK